MFKLAGDNDRSPQGFKECVSQEEVHTVLENARKEMKETVTKTVTKALIELHFGGAIVEMTKRVAALEMRQPSNEEVSGSKSGDQPSN